MDENATYHVGMTDEARRDLENIFRYVAKNLQEPGTAVSLIDELEVGMISLSSMPQRCPERQIGIYAGKGYRQLFVKNYTIIFRVEEMTRQVIMLTIRYSRSNF